MLKIVVEATSPSGIESVGLALLKREDAYLPDEYAGRLIHKKLSAIHANYEDSKCRLVPVSITISVTNYSLQTILLGDAASHLTGRLFS